MSAGSLLRPPSGRAIAGALEPGFASTGGPAGRPSVTVLRRHERRAVFLYRFEHATAQGLAERLVVAKLYAAVPAGLPALLAAITAWVGGAPRPRIRVPRLLGVLPDHNGVLLAHVPGPDLETEVRRQPGDGPALLRLAAQALTALQDCPLTLPPPYPVARARSRLERRLAELHRLHPAVGRRLAEAGGALRAVSEPARPVLSNGCFRASHLFRDGEAFWLIDWDQRRLTHPAYDAGHFLADLSYFGATTDCDRRWLADCRREFLRGVLAGGRCSGREAFAFEAHFLVRAIVRDLRAGVPGPSIERVALAAQSAVTDARREEFAPC